MNKNENKLTIIKEDFVASTYICDGVVSDSHFHNVYEIYYLEKGQRNYLINGKNYPATPGTFILIPPGAPHQTSGTSFKRRLIHFSKNLLDSIFNHDYIAKLLSTFEKYIFICPSKDHDYVLNIFNQAEVFYTKNDPASFAIKTAELLNFISKQVNNPNQENPSTLLINIENFIQESACEIKNLKVITDKFYISKFHLCHLFKQKKGMTIMSYIMDIKIGKAAEMLLATDKKCKEIAQLLGFSSEHYFNKCFTSTLSISPTKYRSKFRNKNKEKARRR